MNQVSSAFSRRSNKFAQKTPQKTILIDRKLKFQPYIVDVRSIAVFTANFVTVRGVLAPLSSSSDTVQGSVLLPHYRTLAFQDSVLTFED